MSAEDGQAGPSEATTASADALPAGLTPGAREAFQDVKDEFRDGLAGELRRRRRSRRDLTSDDVYEARAIVAQAMCQSRQRSGSDRALSTGLIAVGSVGMGVMHPYLHSPWQIALLVVFGLVFVAGVGLAVRSGHPVTTPADPSSS